MPTYRYVASSEQCCPSCAEEFRVIRLMSDEPLEQCKACGSPIRIVIGKTQVTIKAKHRAGYQEYRDDLARFPGDREAFVTSPQQVQRLADKRRREDGWTLRDETWADMADTVPDTKLSEGPQMTDAAAQSLVQESYEEAKKEVGQ